MKWSEKILISPLYWSQFQEFLIQSGINFFIEENQKAMDDDFRVCRVEEDDFNLLRMITGERWWFIRNNDNTKYYFVGRAK